MIRFARIMIWVTAAMFLVSLGFEVFAIVSQRPLSIATWAFLTFTFAVQFFTWRMNLKSELLRRETRAILFGIR